MHAATDYGAISARYGRVRFSARRIGHHQLAAEGFERGAINPSFPVAAAGAESQP
jgi:hypothetical protein